MGFSGHAAKAAPAARRRRSEAIARNVFIRDSLSALELGLPLFHERAPPFRVILAVEAVEDEAAAELHVDVRVGLQHLAEDALPGLDRERRAGGDRSHVLVREGR